jgi:hypothetical protein
MPRQRHLFQKRRHGVWVCADGVAVPYDFGTGNVELRDVLYTVSYHCRCESQVTMLVGREAVRDLGVETESRGSEGRMHVDLLADRG